LDFATIQNLRIRSETPQESVSAASDFKEPGVSLCANLFTRWRFASRTSKVKKHPVLGKKLVSGPKETTKKDACLIDHLLVVAVKLKY